jgi:predicted dehydrogenase
VGHLARVCSARVMARTHRTATCYKGPRGTRAYDGGGGVLTQGIHLIDLIIWLHGDVEQVSAHIRRGATRRQERGARRLSGGPRVLLSR